MIFVLEKYILAKIKKEKRKHKNKKMIVVLFNKPIYLLIYKYIILLMMKMNTLKDAVKYFLFIQNSPLVDYNMLFFLIWQLYPNITL